MSAPPPRLAGAVSLCRAGRFAEAERELRALLGQAPGDADTLQLMGIVASSQGRLDEALDWFERANAARPGNLALMQNRAQALFQMGRLAQVREVAQAMAAIAPDHPAVRDLAARLIHEEGVALHAAGRFAEAAAAYQRAIEGGLDLPQARANLANALDAEGAAHYAAGRFGEAEQAHRRALAAQPDFPQAINNLGNALAALGRQDEALRCFREVLARDPRDENALVNMGAVLHETGDLAGARRSYEQALAQRPDFALAINNLGYLLREEGRAAEAATLFERSLSLAPDNPRAAYNLALARLTQGRFEEGWRLHEARFRTKPPSTARRELAIPPLQRDDVGRVKRVAVWREQGVGDQVVYSTVLPSLAARGQDFVVEIDARLVAAMRRAHPRWAVVAPEESADAFAACDRQAAMADVAALLRPTRESFTGQPRAVLAADPGRASRYRERLALPGRRLVGISWKSFQPKNRAALAARKSVPLDFFAGLARRGDVRLVDLQYGDVAEERARFAGELARLDELDLFNDLDGVMAAIEACDVMVTTSSVTAHLAGALGKRTLLLFLGGLPPFHYWSLAGGKHSLWYPSVEIVSDPSIDTWARALERVDEIL
jgi:tetratricopeptide (TPR) repeat protein/ADP-heptose:LPS heptosyltransferase